MKEYTYEQWQDILSQETEKYNTFCARGLKLDMSRGKPSSEQLDISEGLLTVVASNADCYSANGTDCRNYGLLYGIPEIRTLFAELLGVRSEQILAAGNSSLNLMYDTIVRAMLFGVPGGKCPWGKYEKIRFLCPVPGYDRHFSICENMGIEMINIDMGPYGPDMDTVERLCASDDTIKGIWCVPKYSNPEGKTYSDDTVRRLARMKAAKDFRIFWDNAYALHDLKTPGDCLLNLLEEAEQAGNPDRVYMFASTSKISFPGAGVAVIAASTTNLEDIGKSYTYQTIGPDKLNQLRHVRYFKNADGIRAHMKKHAEHLQPRFEAVLDTLNNQLLPLDIAEWTEPKGGYFISLNVCDGCAKRTVELMKNAGVIITPAGATFPYGKDPRDRNIRIAPTYPPLEELKLCCELLCICVKIATAEKFLNR